MRVLLTLACLFSLVTVTSTYAECAWVLWSFSQPNDGGLPVRVERNEAFESRGECYAKLKELSPRPGVVVGPSQVFNSWWQCWPDTIDPRGPKGK
jgi:hypothetical protein